MSEEYKSIFRKFLVGDINLQELRKYVDDRLFSLRQNINTPENEESKVLSELELIILEVEDGFRQSIEIYDCIKALLSNISTVVSYFKYESSNRDINTFTSASPVREYSRSV